MERPRFICERCHGSSDGPLCAICQADSCAECGKPDVRSDFCGACGSSIRDEQMLETEHMAGF